MSQENATAVLAATVIGAGFVALAVVGWIFWRAAKRDREREGQQPDRGAKLPVAASRPEIDERKRS
jgi:hypothetical protein